MLCERTSDPVDVTHSQPVEPKVGEADPRLGAWVAGEVGGASGLQLVLRDQLQRAEEGAAVAGAVAVAAALEIVWRKMKRTKKQ